MLYKILNWNNSACWYLFSFPIQTFAVSACRRHPWQLSRLISARHRAQQPVLLVCPPVLHPQPVPACSAPPGPSIHPPSCRLVCPLPRPRPHSMISWIWCLSPPLCTALSLYPPGTLDYSPPSLVGATKRTDPRLRRWTQTSCKLSSNLWVQLPPNPTPLPLIRAQMLFPCTLPPRVTLPPPMDLPSQVIHYVTCTICQ